MMKAMSARRFAVIFLCVLGSAGTAMPAPRPIASMITGSVTSQPIGHYEFCERLPNECNIKSPPAAPEKISADQWDMIRGINKAVNARYIPQTDLETYGQEEYWAFPTVYADCEDYALEKRKELIAQGIAVSDLLMTVVRKPDGEGHAVLTLRTANGDFILDNLSEDILPWYQTPYTYLKRQATFNTGRWVTIENGHDLLVGALR